MLKELVLNAASPQRLQQKKRRRQREKQSPGPSPDVVVAPALYIVDNVVPGHVVPERVVGSGV
jgi:hypothetical protein